MRVMSKDQYDLCATVTMTVALVEPFKRSINLEVCNMQIDDVELTEKDRSYMSDEMLKIFEMQEQANVERDKATCYTCGEKPDTSILLSGDDKHWYLPNRGIRDNVNSGQAPEWVTEIWLCHDCLGQIEDRIRETIQRLYNGKRGTAMKLITDPDRLRVNSHSRHHYGDRTYEGTIAYVTERWSDDNRKLIVVIESDCRSHGHPTIVQKTVSVPTDFEYDDDRVMGIRVVYRIKDRIVESIRPVDSKDILPFS
jgi:hypothetical protein